MIDDVLVSYRHSAQCNRLRIAPLPLLVGLSPLDSLRGMWAPGLWEDGELFIRPLAMDFPADPEAFFPFCASHF